MGYTAPRKGKITKPGKVVITVDRVEITDFVTTCENLEELQREVIAWAIARLNTGLGDRIPYFEVPLRLP